MQPNWCHRTLWTGDNLPILRGMNGGCVDLIYLDPPFNSNRDYTTNDSISSDGIPSDSIPNDHAASENVSNGSIPYHNARPLQKKVFKDTWKAEDIDLRWLARCEKDRPALHRALVLAGEAHGTAMRAYLAQMAPRLIELHRILKPGGSLYLHCDPSASHYLKLLLDLIFGAARFQNEIVWCYSTGGASPKRFARKHDTLFFYSKGEAPRFSTLRVPYTSAMSRDRKHRHKFHAAGKIMPDWWKDIVPLNPRAKERLPYPTQKPLALLRRIFTASSRPADMILDPFCGSGTACVAAEQLGRRWAAIDLSPQARTLIRKRFAEASWTAAVQQIVFRQDAPEATPCTAPSVDPASSAEPAVPRRQP